MASYALVVRGNEGFWNSTARKHYESLSKEFPGTLFVRKFMVSFRFKVQLYIYMYLLSVIYANFSS